MERCKRCKGGEEDQYLKHAVKETESNITIAEPCLQLDGCDIPDWLLLEIIVRLPLTIKELFMCKCVSKRWNSLISSPGFVKIYVSQRNNAASSSSSPLPWTILSRYSASSLNKSIPDHMGLDPKFSESNDSPTFSILDTSSFFRRLECKAIASSNGLLLCEDCRYDSNYYFVCNPLTKQWVTLPPPVKYFNSIRIGFIAKVKGEIFTSYKVVVLQYMESRTNIRNMEIFSSKTGTWSNLKVKCPRSIAINWRKGPISVNGILHWFSDETSEIMAYDPYNSMEECRLIKYPTQVPYLGDNGQWGVCQGRLRYVVMLPGILRVWVLKDYDTGTWQCDHTIPYSDILMDHALRDRIPGICPLVFHPFDSAIVYFHYLEKQILSYNSRSEKLELLHNIGSIYGWRALHPCFVIPFVLPLWPSLVPEPLGTNVDFS